VWPHDPEQPGSGVGSVVRVEVFQGAQIGILHHVLGFVVVARQMPRQVEGGIEIRQQNFLELREVSGQASPQVSSRPRVDSKPADFISLQGLHRPGGISAVVQQSWERVTLLSLSPELIMLQESSLPVAVLLSALVVVVPVTAVAQSPKREHTEVSARLSEWSVKLNASVVPAGPVTFHVRNEGSIPHGFEVEGGGVEKELAPIAAGDSASLDITLKPGKYEVYCPVGGDSHKRLGMVTQLEATSGRASLKRKSEYGGTTATSATTVHGLRVRGGGPVIQILPGPFPFPDSAAAVIKGRPTDQRTDLMRKEEEGPYSNKVARIAGTLSLSAWDLGPTRDSVNGTAEFRTEDGKRWRVVMDRVQTKDIPFNPRFGGVITGLFYHGATGLHTPLVPTIRSRVALWAYAHLYQGDSLVTDSAMVHVMLLSRTRRSSDFALACWDCSREPIEELQLQVTPLPGQPKFDAPGGFLFINWEQSRGEPL
jgi:cupredoxin-like protein